MFFFLNHPSQEIPQHFTIPAICLKSFPDSKIAFPLSSADLAMGKPTDLTQSPLCECQKGSGWFFRCILLDFTLACEM